MVEARAVSRHFGPKVALNQVSVAVVPGEIHALLGPNGAGKTTLLRILAGLTEPSQGAVHLMGGDMQAMGRAGRGLIGLVPSGERSFYHRLSGFENLLFFARLYGLSASTARSRARALLDRMGLLDAANLRVGLYSHGMQKRLSIARGLLCDPPLLLLDEATHDLDPQGARRVRDLAREAAGSGAGIAWATQRVEEIRGFADTVTLLHQGRVRFSGSVAQLGALSVAQRYMVRLRNGTLAGVALQDALREALGGMAAASPDASGDDEHYTLVLGDGVLLGDVMAALAAARFQVLSCQEERPEIEEAFLRLTEGES